MFVERPFSTARQISLRYILLIRIIYLNGRRLHLVRGCGEMSSAKVLKVLAISHLLQENLIFVLGSMQPEFKLTLPRSKSILDCHFVAELCRGMLHGSRDATSHVVSPQIYVCLGVVG
jgi:hypothetical protein